MNQQSLFLFLVLFLSFLPASTLLAQETVTQAMKLAEADDPDGARKMLEAIVARNAGDSDAHHQLGKLLFEHYGELDGAEEQLARAVQLAGGRADYHFTLGRVYGAIAQNGGFFSAMTYARKVKEEFVRAVELDPRNLTYRTGLLRYYLQAPAIVGGSVSRAREQADTMLHVDAYEGHMAYAEIAAHESDQQSAEREYKAAIATAPKRPQAHFRLGYHYLAQKKHDEAVSEFREYVKCAPDDPNSHDSIAEGLLEKGDYDEALREYNSALSLDPRFASALYGAARCYEGKRMKTEALLSYQKFLSLDPRGKKADEARRKVEELQH